MEVEDFHKAKPDNIAHSSDDIVSHLKAGGEKTIIALKALCWRCKGIQVEVCFLLQSGCISLAFCFKVSLIDQNFGMDAFVTYYPTF